MPRQVCSDAGVEECLTVGVGRRQQDFREARRVDRIGVGDRRGQQEGRGDRSDGLCVEALGGDRDNTDSPRRVSPPARGPSVSRVL
jgi:hypothetical protein